MFWLFETQWLDAHSCLLVEILFVHFFAQRSGLGLCVWAGIPTMSTRQLSESTSSCCRSDIPLADWSFSSFEVPQSYVFIWSPFLLLVTFVFFPLSPVEFPLWQWSGSQVTTIKKRTSRKHLTAHECPLCMECGGPVRVEFLCSGCQVWVWQVTTWETGFVGVRWFQSFLPGLPSPEKQYKQNFATTNRNEKKVTALKQLLQE